MSDTNQPVLCGSEPDDDPDDVTKVITAWAYEAFWKHTAQIKTCLWVAEWKIQLDSLFLKIDLHQSAKLF